MYTGIELEEKHVSVTNGYGNGESSLYSHRETNTKEAASSGQVATDQHGNPLIQFNPAAEAKLRHKIDLFVIPTVAILYLFAFIDRANIGNARLAGLEKELKLEGYDYNVILSAFYVSYIVFEIPSNMACKALGPGWYLPTTSLLFGLTSICTAFTHTKAEIAGVRFVLGIFEAAMLPGISYYLSRWYRRSELVFRLALFIVMAPIAGAFGGLFASAILKLDHFGTTKHWRMIFAIEGMITTLLAAISFFTLTDRPETARWLSAEEKEMAIARVKSERVGATEVLDKLDKTKVLRGILSPVTLGTSFIFLLNNITIQGLAFFLPTIIKTIYPTKTVIEQQLRSVPPYVVGAFTTLLIPFISSRTDRRTIFLILTVPLMMTGYLMFLATDSHDVRYAATFLIAAGSFPFGPICNAQVAANVISDSSRSSAIGMNVMMGNLGGLVSTWSFLPNDAPNFHIGNGLNFAAGSTILITAIALYFWMVADNARRQRKDVVGAVAGLTTKQIQDLDWKHPGFRWKP